MSDTKKTARTRGRPRAFCEEAALDAAAALFAERGFDAVTIAELTDAMGIRPPSFYAAFGSKAAAYERVLDRAITADPFVTEALEGAESLRDGLRALLRAAARRYADGTGCLVAEGVRACTDEAARGAAAARLAGTRAAVERFAETRGADGARVAGLTVTALLGLSAAARAGAQMGEGPRAGERTEVLDAFARLTADAIARDAG